MAEVTFSLKELAEMYESVLLRIFERKGRPDLGVLTAETVHNFVAFVKETQGDSK